MSFPVTVPIDMTVTCALTETDLDDILGAFFEGPPSWLQSYQVQDNIADWGDLAEAWRDERSYHALAAGASLLLWDENDDYPAGALLRRTALLKAIEDTARQGLIPGFSADPEDWIGNVDADIADLIVQRAAFGDQVYA